MLATFLSQVVNGLILGSLIGLIALGYTMVYGIIQLINFAHGEVVMIGAMVALTVINALVGARISITSQRAQTTRHHLRGILTRPGAQFVFVDVASPPLVKNVLIAGKNSFDT